MRNYTLFWIGISFLSSGCAKKTSIHDFCKAHSKTSPEEITFDLCVKRVASCTEEELYDPGYTPPCYFAKEDPCKKDCESFWQDFVKYNNPK